MLRAHLLDLISHGEIFFLLSAVDHVSVLNALQFAIGGDDDDFQLVNLVKLGGLSLGISDIGLIAFPVIVVGGLDSLAGALIAGFLLGILEAFTEGILTPNLEEFLRSVSNVQSVGALQQVIPYALLVLMLLLRPQGIFGRRGAERV